MLGLGKKGRAADGVLRHRPAQTPASTASRVQQLTTWAEPTAKEGPARILRRQGVRALLGTP
jgi:hypothetical protein